MRQPAQDLEQWGKWMGRYHYSLEMVQNPQRARMCGFGDKDRRPLAPAAVAKMVVKREDHSIVDVDDVDISFFIVTVDLWSEDGKHERNLVLHPSSGERYVPVHIPTSSKPPRRRGTTSNVPGPPPPSVSGQQTPTPSTPAQTPGPSYGPNYFPTAPASPMAPPGAVAFSPGSPYAQPAQPGTGPTWGYPSGPDRNTTYPPSHPPFHPLIRTQPWSNDNSVAAAVFETPDPHQQRDSAAASPWDQSAATTVSPESTLYNPSPNTMAVPVPFFPTAAASTTTSYAQPTAPPPPTTTVLRASSSAYTRTLVGPLSSNGYRLLDEHRKPGVFFLFQDLSVRTEGTFRLRFRLMNVGAPPAPEPGATQVHTSVSPVLAQIYSEPFIVFSAKRFPGVPETTALSIAFGNQGLKLPLRNRHGSSKRRRNSMGYSDDDSDG
ncbi:Velvet domain-containing protein [Mycena chlorophos]|uniref:Velvet domain-containing protein n=1 Tax=Mycena chlorophos TaxID=658473 RepID=A0A8H6VT31_MYCCL|nr:Velvet domain-containing protein [Mycena chlorophos]